jgi:hypothetical protein
MRCSKCGSYSPAGKKFCADCGASLASNCPKCGAENPPSKRFCGDCGIALGDSVGQAFQPVAPVAGVEGAMPLADSTTGERRHLTVLFCDLVGSTEIASRLDPEEWRELVAGDHRAAAEAITRYGGHWPSISAMA